MTRLWKLVGWEISPDAITQSSRFVRLAERRVSVAWSPTLRLILHRLLTAIPVLLGVTLLTFVIVNLLPGNAALHLLGADATPEQVARLAAQLGLDKPAWERYWEWLTRALTGDLGESLANSLPVAALIGERLPVTLELVVYAFVLSIGFAVPVALLASRKPDGLFDRLSTALCLTGLSTANYVLAFVLVLVFSVTLGIFPSIGFTALSESVARNIVSLTLPATALAFPLFGFYAQFLRGDLLEQMNGEDYIVGAIAKGLGPWQVLVRHALRNSSFGLLTLVGLNFGTLIGGTVVIEQIFSLPGVGQLLLQAIDNRDVVVVQAMVLLLAVATVMANLVADVLYLLLDPRVRYGGR